METVKKNEEEKKDKIRLIYSDQKTQDDVIYDLMEVEKEAYIPEYRGEFEAIRKRFEEYKEMFVLAYDNEKLIGYLCFFPVSDRLYEELLNEDKFHDDDILPEDIRTPAESGHIYLLSIALKDHYKGMGIGTAMMNTFWEKIRYYRENGCLIKDVLASAVTEEGNRLIRKAGFELVKDHSKTSRYLLYRKEMELS